MSTDRDRQPLADMLEHALYARGFLEAVTLDEFMASRVLQFATVRALEVIGEAAKAVPADVRALAPSIPWAQVTVMRDKLAHRYFGVDLGIVWETVVTDLPALIEEVSDLLEKLGTPG